jgi:hypothetical protein
MAILEQAVKTIKNYSIGDTNQALIDILIAVDATSKKEYSSIKGNGARYKMFLDDNMYLIKIVSINVRMTNKISFRNMHLNENLKKHSSLSLSEIIYHIIRCNLLHEAELPITILFHDLPEIKLELDKMVLPKNLILALLVSIITAKSNADNKFIENYELNIFGNTIPLNQIWGNKELALKFLG